MTRVDWARITRAGCLKAHEIREGEIKMASARCFRLVAVRRSAVIWRKIAFSSTCRNLGSGNVFQRKFVAYCRPAWITNVNKNRIEEILYESITVRISIIRSICTASWGSIHAVCWRRQPWKREWHDIPCSSEKEVHDKTPTKFVRGASGRFSSVQKIQKMILRKSFSWTCRTAGPLWKENYIIKVTVKSRTKCAASEKQEVCR